MKALQSGLLCILAATAFACWAVALASLLLASSSRRPDVPRAALLEGRFDVMYRPSLLTPEGRRHRRRCLFAVAGFLLCGLLGTLIALVADWARG